MRRYAENDSIFVGEDYLIKGVAGAILWRLVRGSWTSVARTTRTASCGSIPRIRLPDVSENLEARLILLQRRLEERCPGAAHREDRSRPVPASTYCGRWCCRTSARRA